MPTLDCYLGNHWQGAKQLYRVVVHPFLLKREAQIDIYIAKVGTTGLNALRRVSKEGFNIAATAIVTTAMKVREGGGGEEVLGITCIATV